MTLSSTNEDVALRETGRTMAESDGVIDQHGGWPNAFVTGMDGDP